MKQIEITVRLVDSFEDAVTKLEKKGFTKSYEGDIYDIYLSNYEGDMKKENIQMFLKRSVLLRSLKFADRIVTKITYKDKEYDENGDVVSEKKVNLDCNDLDRAKSLFNCLGFRELIEVKYHVVSYKKDGVEFAFQIVDNLGTLMEYENVNDFENKNREEIKAAKMQMMNEVRACEIGITDEYDVKKAYELIVKKYGL